MWCKWRDGNAKAVGLKWRARAKTFIEPEPDGDSDLTEMFFGPTESLGLGARNPFYPAGCLSGYQAHAATSQHLHESQFGRSQWITHQDHNDTSQ